MVFIRAPYIKTLSDRCIILSKIDDNKVAERCDNQLVTAFHPELTNDFSVFNYLIKMVHKYINNL